MASFGSQISHIPEERPSFDILSDKLRQYQAAMLGGSVELSFEKYEKADDDDVPVNIITSSKPLNMITSSSNDLKLE